MKIFNHVKIIECLKLHRVWIETIGDQGKKLGLDEIDFREFDLIGYPLNQAYLTACKFDGMNLSSCDMSSSLLCSSTFKSTSLVNADFYKTDLSYADFTNANAQNARFAKTDCSEAIFLNANLENSKLISCSLDLTDFQNANLKNVDISLSAFEGTLLKGTTLVGIKGLEEAFIKSINIGTQENPIILLGEKAREWIQNKSINR
ncbi:pentapeptide repeat-containing protein [Lysinibacillus xylanilyticus]|uniref:pentapeptide repeat-containing protein n=1 Tax=Lysinibacillus xylanilyticus TaxID=582475 RepID=UPI003822BA44